MLATVTEVYTLNAAFAASLLLIGVRLHIGQPPSRRAKRFWLAVFGLLFGLGLGNHLTLLAVGVPVWLWLLASRDWKSALSPWLIAAFLTGISVYAYLPLRAAQEPVVNWGDASTLAGFVWMLTGRAYQDYLGVPIAALPARAFVWAGLMFSQFTVLGVFFAIAGARQLAQSMRGLLAVLLAASAILSVYSILFNSVDNEVLLLPVVMSVAILAGVGAHSVIEALGAWAAHASLPLSSLARILRRLPAQSAAAALIVVAVAVVPLSSVALNYERLDLSGDDEAIGYATSILDEVPDGVVVLSMMEGRVFSLWYASTVVHSERDVLVVAVPLLQFDWYWRSLSARYPDRVPRETPDTPEDAIRLIVEHNAAHTPAYFTYRDQYIHEHFAVERQGRLFVARLREDAHDDGMQNASQPPPVSVDLLPSY
jgi:hypothetical protein